MPPPKVKKMPFRFRPNYLAAFIRSIIVLGIIGKERFHYWGLLFWTMFSRPRLLPQAVTLSIYGFHFRKVFEKRHGRRPEQSGQDMLEIGTYMTTALKRGAENDEREECIP